MKKGLLLFTTSYVIAFLQGDKQADILAHITNGYPELFDSYNSGTLLAKEVDVPDGVTPEACKYDGTSFVTLTPQELATKEANEEATLLAHTRIERILGRIDREAKRFIANRLLTNTKITQQEYDLIIGYIGLD
jgi:hypothetical protein